MSCEGEQCITKNTGKTALQLLRLSEDAGIEEIYERSVQMATPFHPQNGNGQKSNFEFRVIMHSTYSALFALISQTCRHQQCKDLEYLLRDFSCLERCLNQEHHEGHCNENFYFNILGNFYLTYRKFTRKQFRQMKHHFLTPLEVRELGKFYDELAKMRDEKCDMCKNKRRRGKQQKSNSPPPEEKNTSKRNHECKASDLDGGTTKAIVKKDDNCCEEEPRVPPIHPNPRSFSPAAKKDAHTQREDVILEDFVRSLRYLEDRHVIIRGKKSGIQYGNSELNISERALISCQFRIFYGYPDERVQNQGKQGPQSAAAKRKAKLAAHIIEAKRKMNFGTI